MGVASTPSARVFEMATALGEASGMSDERSESIKVILLCFLMVFCLSMEVCWWLGESSWLRYHGGGGPASTFLAPHCSVRITTAASFLPGIFPGYLVLRQQLVSIQEACTSGPGQFEQGRTGLKKLYPGPMRLGSPLLWLKVGC